MRRIAGPLALVALLASLVTARAVTGPVTKWGYFPTRDGARLRYTVVLPDGEGRFPVALIWSVYSDDAGPTGGYPPAESPVIAEALLDAGYAILGVGMRGTGCSGGRWDLFQPASDGYDVVEWAAAQEWSTGDVGMFGFSAPGISQLLTAATHPPHLRAITPADVSTDFYRDVAYPGGINNPAFTGFWTMGSLPAHEALSVAYGAAQGDAECAVEIARRPQPNHGPDLVRMTEHPYFDESWERYHPEPVLDEVEVPLLGCQAAQDDQVSSHPFGWPAFVDPATSWMVYTNGNHGTCDDYTTPYTDLVVRFFERYVRGVANGFESEPHAQIWHETTHDDAAGANVPGWVTTHSWPVPVEPATFYLGAGGALTSSPSTEAAASDSYLYPLPSSSMESNEYTPSNTGWKIPSVPGGFVAYTSTPLGSDMELFGSGSADLWLSSTASDTDVQVTLTEIRPDGNEVYVSRGWLRASHRALDPARATSLLPYHTHAEADAAPLPAGEQALVRVEINPMTYVFRAGSRVRLHVEAPTGVTGMFGFDFLKTPSLNSIHRDSTHVSKLVLGVVPGGVAAGGYPPCDGLISHPCRRDFL